MGVASSPYWAFHQGGAHTAASRVPPSSPGGGSPLAPPLSGKLPLGRYHPSFRDLTGVGPQASSPSTMESTQEKPAESSSPVPGSEEPAGLARDPEVLPPKESEGCARPLETAPKKICGYLSKFGGKGPIRGWKSRWFFYDERKCHLYYSRTAQDANPLDSIDLSSAVFDCKADAEEGTFEIKTPSRIITLKVNGAVFFLFSRDEIPGHSRAQVGGHSKLTIITDPDQPSEPWVPRVLYFPKHIHTHFLIGFPQQKPG